MKLKRNKIGLNHTVPSEIFARFAERDVEDQERIWLKRNGLSRYGRIEEYCGLVLSGFDSLLEDALRIELVEEFLPVLWSSGAQVGDHLARVPLLCVGALRAVCFDCVRKEACNSRRR